MTPDDFINPSDKYKEISIKNTRPLKFKPQSVDGEWDKEGEEVIPPIPVKGIEIEGPREEYREKAQKFIALVGEGMAPHKAAKKLGTTVGAILSRSEMQDAITSILEVGGLKSEVKREVLRAGLFKIFVEGVVSTDPHLKKLALDASKQIAADPEIGLAQAETSVQIDLGSLGTALQGASLPGIKNPYLHEHEKGGEE